jgi:hypothetical protein
MTLPQKPKPNRKECRKEGREEGRKKEREKEKHTENEHIFFPFLGLIMSTRGSSS